MSTELYQNYKKQQYILFQKALESNNLTHRKINKMLFENFLPNQMEIEEENPVEKSNNLSRFLKSNPEQLVSLRRLSLKFQSRWNPSRFEGKLSANQYLDKLLNVVPENLQELSLDLGCSSLDYEGLKKMTKLFQKLSCLKVLQLNLRENQIDSEGINIISKEIICLNNLEKLELNLWNNSIEQSGAEILSQNLCKLQNLKEIEVDLYGNYIGEQGCISLSQKLSEISGLKRLKVNLGLNNIGVRGLEYILYNVQNMQNLDQLCLEISWNQLQSQIIEVFQQNIGYISRQIKDVKINIKQNNISESDIIPLLEQISQIKTSNSIGINAWEHSWSEEIREKIEKIVEKSKNANFDVIF